MSAYPNGWIDRSLHQKLPAQNQGAKGHAQPGPSRPRNEHGFDFKRIPPPDLTACEELLPPAQKNIRILLKKCQMVNSYNFFEIQELIHYLQIDVSPPIMTQENAVYLYGNGPHEFYISWFPNTDKTHLLGRWLTAEVKDGRIPVIDIGSDSEDLIGSLVLAYCKNNCYWYRAEVRNLIEDDIMEVFLVDRGITQRCDVSKYPLREIPVELFEVRAFAFKCRLADIDYSIDPELDFYARFNFLNWVNGKEGALTCAVKRSDPVTDHWEVYLLKGDPPKSVNERIRKEYYNRKKTAGIIMQEPLDFVDETQVLYMNRDVDIKDYDELTLKGLRVYQVVHIVSPAYFFVHYITERCASLKLPWQTEMQIYYDSPVNDERNKLRTSRAIMNRCYVWKDPEDGTWERVRVIEINTTTRSVRILLMDVGRRCEVGYEALREINPRFTYHCALGFRSHLVDLKPPAEDGNWPEESIAGFKKLTLGKLFHGIIITRDKLVEGTQVPMDTYSLGLVLVEKDPKVTCCLNSTLCGMGLAAPDGVASGRSRGTLAPTSDRGFNFEDMRAALLDEDPLRRQAKTLFQKGKEAAGGFGRGGRCAANFGPFAGRGWGASSLAIGPNHGVSENGSGTSGPGTSSAAIAIGPNDGVTADRSGADALRAIRARNKPPTRTFWKSPEDELLQEALKRLPVEIRLRLAMCHITHINTPSSFYLQTMERVPELKVMMTYLGDEVKEKPELTGADLALNTFVAVSLLDQCGVPIWHRAIVTDTTLFSIQVVKVMLVDFGNEVTAKWEAVRALPRYFWTVPGYAQRVHMDVKDLVPSRGRWSPMAVESFRRYLGVWEEDMPIYYVWRRNEAANIQLTEIGEEVVFSPEAGAWVKEPARAERVFSFNPAHGHVMVQRLLVSMGVDVAYEILTGQDEAYKFEKVSECLFPQASE